MPFFIRYYSDMIIGFAFADCHTSYKIAITSGILVWLISSVFHLPFDGFFPSVITHANILKSLSKSAKDITFLSLSLATLFPTIIFS